MANAIYRGFPMAFKCARTPVPVTRHITIIDTTQIIRQIPMVINSSRTSESSTSIPSAEICTAIIQKMAGARKIIMKSKISIKM